MSVISVQEATAIILQHAGNWGDEPCALEEAVGRVLAEDLFADRDFPPFTRVSMDGIAIRFEDYEKGLRTFPVAGIQAAGSPQLSLEQPGHCLEVMTGAILPQNTDTVIPYEDLEWEEGIATLVAEEVRPRQNAHPQGSDRRQGAQLIQRGHVLSAAEIGVAATIGKAALLVRKQPRIAVVSTGDELVEVDQQPLPHQIRQSNAYTLQAALRDQGIPAERAHINDQEAEIRRTLEALLEEYDVLIMSGGVSKGKFDFLPRILEEFQVQQLFHRVQHRPGKPFWFGVSPDQKPVFAFPGNPVSAFMCLYRYFFPWYRKSMGMPERPAAQALLDEPVSYKPHLTYFLQVRVRSGDQGQLIATPMSGRGSGDLANLVLADGFLELPAGAPAQEKGQAYPLYLYRPNRI